MLRVITTHSVGTTWRGFAWSSGASVRGLAGSSKTSEDDASRKQVEREIMKKELGKMLVGGALADARAAAKNDDSKLFPTTIVNPEGAPLLPDSLRKVETLDGKEVTLPHQTKHSAILLAFNQLGWSMLDDWMACLPEKKVRVVRLSVVEGFGSTFAHSFILGTLKKSVPSSMFDKVALKTGSFAYEKRALGIENKAVGYAFLFDSNARLGLKGCGGFTDADRNTINTYLSQIR